MTAPAIERPALTVVPAPASPVDALPLAAARVAFSEMLDALGIDTRPAPGVSADALLALLLQASGAHVATTPAVADHATWLGAVAGYHPPQEAAS
ncbi:hypothetical protein [Actinomadura rubrisoli]|uniref:Uncharacterized protein n=1 Tax=Actinomadura rubrisoli TaxID=2530368 RepID=A0A4R5CGS6_9ACTN|nr:hypothetical protein [Actinomadura rubrisoli]TDD97690.1 hypothetical protein E1298_01245 [Actinomadura rubrisoli]